MFTAGNITIILYLASCTCFLFGAIYPKYLYVGAAFGALFFLVSWLIIAVMMKIRYNS